MTNGGGGGDADSDEVGGMAAPIGVVGVRGVGCCGDSDTVWV